MGHVPNSDDRGTALVAVLWLATLLAVSITYLTLNSIQSIQVSQGLSNLTRSGMMAESAVQLWVAQLRAELLSSRQGLVISEVMDRWPDQRASGLLVTRIVNGENNQWIEIFNPHDTKFLLEQFSELHSIPGNQDKHPYEIIPPGEYRYMCHKHACDSVPDQSKTIDHFRLNLTAKDGIEIRSVSNTEEKFRSRDRVLWSTGDGLYDHLSIRGEDDAVPLDSPKFVLKRVTKEGKPVDTNQSNDDFRVKSLDQVKTKGYESLKNGFPPEDVNEYVEIVNLGSRSIDPVDETVQLRDACGKEGRRISSNNWFNLAPYKGAETSFPTTMKPGDVGLIVHRNVNLDRLEVWPSIRDGSVKLFTLKNAGGNQARYLNNGIGHRVREKLVIRNKHSSNKDEFQLGEVCEEKKPTPGLAVKKDVLTGPNKSSNWTKTDRFGSPGTVPEPEQGPADVDYPGEAWGRDGQFLSGHGMDQSFFFPSLKTTRQPHDYGKIRLIKLEDESGKINLKSVKPDRHRRWASDLQTYDVLTDSQARNVNDTFVKRLKTPGDMFRLGVNDLSNWSKLKGNYSVYRRDDAININTASYEALRSIKINQQPGSPRTFLTHAMAEAILNVRERSTPGDQVDYFLRTEQACDLPAMRGSPSFRCGVFKRNTRVESNGVFRGVIEAVVFDHEGNESALKRVEVYVDRAPLDGGEGPIRVIYQRFL